MEFEYNWMASLATFVLVVLIVIAGKFLVFQVPAFRRARTANKEQNYYKLKSRPEKYFGRLKSSQYVALATNVVFFVAVLPFFVTFQQQSVGQILLDTFLILMVYDFFYYLTHRFLFHGKGYFRKVHAVHHQARSRVSTVDALLLHPWEAFIGIALFFAVTAVLSLALQHPFHVATIVICNVVYTQVNTFNHCRFDLDKFPGKLLHWISLSHDSHHINMHKGNYATLTLFYDWLFRTLEPINQPEQVEATVNTKTWPKDS